jgi:hypothetical protein
VSERSARIYVITPEPPSDERAAIVEALERVAHEQEAPSAWPRRARREAVDDGLD